MTKVKVVILIGGPSKGTRFRPLSLERAKPLFPVAGHELIYHHLQAAAKLTASLELAEVLLIGFYNIDDSWNTFLQNARQEFGINIRYLKEDSRLGTAGGLSKFRGEILAGEPDCFFVLHCDIVCSFPLVEILQFHKEHGKECTILGKKVSQDEAHKYGCLAVDPSTNEVLHYAEKPETFVSDIINGGVYLFSPSIFKLIDSAPIKRLPNADPHFLRLEQDLLMNICGEKHVYMYLTKDFWLQIKSAGMVVKCAEYLLALWRRNDPQKLAKSSSDGPTIVGDVIIHPTAKVDPTAKLGPNASIGANVTIGPGVRILHSIILDNVEVKEHACIMQSIVGWDSVIGEWSRLEGVPNFENPDERCAGMTILGTGVSIAPEVIIRSSIVLPHKDLSGCYYNTVLL